MKTFHQLAELPPFSEPLALTIGNFDGVHLGHQAVFAALPKNRIRVALSFQNHPSEVVGAAARPRLCTPTHRQKLLAEQPLDLLLLLNFTPALAQQTPEQFLATLRRHLPFTDLTLGHDAAFGKGRQGDSSHIRSLAQSMGFTIDYLPLFSCSAGQPITSSRIRNLISTGDLSAASTLLGRPYSLHGTVIRGRQLGRTLGFPTANMDVSSLCLPPLGIYTSTFTHNNTRYPSISSLGIAPTVRNTLLLETHLLFHSLDLYDQPAEVTLHTYLRPELTFPSLSSLRTQIAADVTYAKSLQND